MAEKENYPPLRYISEEAFNPVEITVKALVEELIKDLDCMKGTSENDFSTITVKKAITQINGQYEEIENCYKFIEQLKEARVSWEDKCKEQQAEIERFKKIETTVNGFWSELQKLAMFKDKEIPTLEELLEYMENLKSEAIKEFAERLDRKFAFSSDTQCISAKTIRKSIQNELKEMVGDEPCPTINPNIKF